MARAANEQIWVWLDDPAFGPLQHIGTLSRGDRGSVRFAYNKTWLMHAHTFPLDPELDIMPGEFFPANSNFGVFMDSCPDRWGQVLMQRRDVVEAREEGRTPRTLGPWEFLLGVQDCTRMGALRFSHSDAQDFLANEALAAPPIAKIDELQAIAFELTKKKQDDLGKIKEWLKVLVAPGSSLGGARPKANVVDDEGSGRLFGGRTGGPDRDERKHHQSEALSRKAKAGEGGPTAGSRSRRSGRVGAAG